MTAAVTAFASVLFVFGGAVVVPMLSPATPGGPTAPTVADGDVQFRVLDVDPVGATVTDGFLVGAARGSFVRVSLDAANGGDQPVVISHAYQSLIDDSGTAVPAATATLLLDGSGAVFRRQLAPGGSFRGAPLLFDVPAGFEPVALRLQAGPDSPGVTVALRS